VLVDLLHHPRRVPQPGGDDLDWHPGRERRRGYAEEAERLEALGAQKLWFSDDRGGPCWTMADVEGNEFCVD